MTGATRPTLTIEPIKTILLNLNKPHLQPLTLTKPPLNPQISHTIINFSQINPKPMSIFSSIHFSSSNFIPNYIFCPSNSPFFTPLKIQSLPSKSSNIIVYRSINIERLSLKPIYSTSTSTGPLQPIEELPPKLQEIVELFQEVEQPKAKYEQLLFYGRNLRPLDNEYKTNDNKVQGCVSQGLSRRPVEEVVRVTPDFVTLLGLQQSLTPSRNNGFLNMLKLMQKKALQLYVEAEKANDSMINKTDNEIEELDLEVKNDNVVMNVSGGENTGGSDSGSGGYDGSLGSRGTRIKERLELELRPVELVVEDISYQHAGHAGARGSDGETHFNVKVVSDEFEGKSLVKRHRLIYGLLQDELENGLHALSIVAKTPYEVEGH
ncbi:hypothetical protein Leryth_014888 [Lithospermum erythrorhizon]|nr:hypothetical protein Leryth_014888 [Lithospermum erythrorhizon]